MAYQDYNVTDTRHSVFIHDASLGDIDWNPTGPGPNALLDPEDPAFDPNDTVNLPWYESPVMLLNNTVEVILSYSDGTVVGDPYVKVWGVEGGIYGTMVGTYATYGVETEIYGYEHNGALSIEIYQNNNLIMETGRMAEVPFYSQGVLSHAYISSGPAGTDLKSIDILNARNVRWLENVINTEFMDVHLADNIDGETLRELMTVSRVDDIIAEAVKDNRPVFLEDNLKGRNNHQATADRNVMVIVLDPMAGTLTDPTVSSGAAMYLGIYNTNTDSTDWTKVYEAESLDLVFDYTDILNTPVLPSSTAAEIDTFVVNLTALQTNVANLFSATETVDGDIVYNGSTLSNAGNVSLATVNW